jgi:NodT family efflux transporter outer membrane factor (OMF) lipoprotein
MISFRHRALTVASLFGWALLLSSCAVGPDFVTPAPPATKTYTLDGDPALKGAQRIVSGKKPSAQWWRAFGSPALDQVMAQALRDNNDLAAARERLARVREMASAVAGASLWPQISLTGEAGRKKYGVALFGPSDIRIAPFTYYTFGPQVSYLLDFAGGERRTVEQQRAFAEAERHRLNAVRLSLAGHVVAQVLEIASAKAQGAVLEDIIGDDRQNLDLVRISRQAGAATMTDVLSAESQLARDLALLPPLHQERNRAEHALSILAGKAPADWRGPDFKLSQLTLPRELPLSLPSELVRDRPDIRAAEAQLHAAAAAIGIATARLYPSITLTANTLQQSLRPEGLFNAAGNTWALAAGLTAPIFNGGSLRAKKRAAEDAYREAFAHYRQVVLESFGQVADVLTALAHDSDLITAQHHARETARAALKLARISYREGNIGVLQVLDAQRLFNQARLEMTRTRVRRYQDTALLYLALGGAAISSEAQPDPARPGGDKPVSQD